MSNFNFIDLMKNAKKMQGMVEQAQEELTHLDVMGESGGGAVQVKMNARHQVRSIHIDDEILNEPKAVLEELIVAAVNDATAKADDAGRKKMMDAAKFFGGGGAADAMGDGQKS